ncbi:MAG: mechanosensitive ion channel [Bacteroidaceae bacterium]|nr:mechanosensitive ion channel [Bacteroidaceae bacterium]
MNITIVSSGIMQWIKLQLAHLGTSDKWIGRAEPLIYIIIIAIVSFVVAEVTYRLAQLVLKRLLRLHSYTFLKKMAEHNAIRRHSHIIPPVIMLALLPLAFDSNSTLFHYCEKFVWLYFSFMLTLSINSLITVIGETVFNNSRYHNRPIKGLVQIAKIIVGILMAIVAVSILTNKSPLYLIGGLGAFAAVLMLITKDSIMGFVGGYLLLENDMIRIGDWIEMPGSAINGIVYDISLTIVKVRNFDNTMATIPPYTLINESFINWRGMKESGGRRIARGYVVKLNNIYPCDKDFIERILGKEKKLQNFISEYGKEKLESSSESIDTNVGLFRLYADKYLRDHPRIRKDMLIMVRTLEPTGNGLPLQFYCFTDTTDWKEYENIQSQIMEHFASIMPLFELYPYQSSSSRDTIISGMLEASFPIEKIKGMPYNTTE